MKKKLLVTSLLVASTLFVGCGIIPAKQPEVSAPVETNDPVLTDEEQEKINRIEEMTAEAEKEALDNAKTDLESDIEEPVDAEPVDDETTTDATSEKTAEDFYSQPEIKAQMDTVISNLIAQNAGVFKDIKWEVNGNSYTYTYYIEDSIETTDEMLKSIESGLIAQKDTLLASERKLVGVDDITIEFIYIQGDKELINVVYE